MANSIPRIQQYLGVWSIEPNAERTIKNMLKTQTWQQHVAEFRSRVDEGNSSGAGGYEVTEDGVAIVDLEGVLTKYGSSLSEGGSTVRFRQTLRSVRSAYKSGQVKSAMLVIESPGGSTMGTPEAAAEVASLAKVMPVWTYFEDIGASAAYWIGSQATRVIANASAMVGSIGTYFAIDDVSQAFTNEGIKTYLFTTGKHKGAGYTGTELTKDQQAEFKSLVGKMNAPFIAAVQHARELDDTELENVTDGRIWRGDEAVAVGLIDAVMSYEDALAELSSHPTNTQTNGATIMKPRASTTILAAKSEDEKKKEDELTEEEKAKAEEDEKKKEEEKAKAEEEEDDEEKDKPASAIGKMKAALPNASSHFILSALESSMTIDQARTAWLEQTVASQSKQIEALKSAQATAPGAKPLGAGANLSKQAIADPKAAWEAAIKSKAEGGMSRAKATSAVVKDQPELHQAYIEACNVRSA